MLPLMYSGAKWVAATVTASIINKYIGSKFKTKKDKELKKEAIECAQLASKLEFIKLAHKSNLSAKKSKKLADRLEKRLHQFS